MKDFSATPSELPPPISVAVNVPAIKIGPNRLPATIKSSFVLIFFEDIQPIKSINKRYATTMTNTIVFMIPPVYRRLGKLTHILKTS